MRFVNQDAMRSSRSISPFLKLGQQFKEEGRTVL
jgi:hypothetical protein